MENRNIKTEYRGWRFFDKVPLISREDQWKYYFDGKFDGISVDIDADEIRETIETALDDGLDCKLGKVHKHIEDAKEHLCCDICHSKNDIKRHIDSKIDPIHFEEQFSNLNEQVAEILNRLG